MRTARCLLSPPAPRAAMAVVPGLNIGVGLLLLIVVWAAALLVSLALAAVPKAR